MNEFHYAKSDSRGAYGGVTLQQFEFTKVCMGKDVNGHFSQNFSIKNDLHIVPHCLVIFLLGCYR